MKTNVSIVIALLILISACKKENPSNPVPEKEPSINEDLKAYFDFKVGSYWVYKDAITQSIDSVYLSKISESKSTKEINDTLYTFKNIYYGYTHSFQPKQTMLILCNNRHFAEYQTEFLLSTIPLLGVPFGQSVLKTAEGDVITVPTEKPVAVGNLSFTKGIEMPWIAGQERDSGSPINKNPFVDFKITYARNVGIIRREVKNNTLHQVWELVDYKIIR